MLLPLLYFEATEAVLLYLVSGVALKVETSRRLSSGKLVAPKEDNIHYRQKGVAGCKGCNLFEKDLEQTFLMAWNGIVENREGFLPAWEKQIREGDALEKWRGGIVPPHAFC